MPDHRFATETNHTIKIHKRNEKVQTGQSFASVLDFYYPIFIINNNTIAANFKGTKDISIFRALRWLLLFSRISRCNFYTLPLCTAMNINWNWYFSDILCLWQMQMTFWGIVWLLLKRPMWCGHQRQAYHCGHTEFLTMGTKNVAR